jgi:MFS family permease
VTAPRTSRPVAPTPVLAAAAVYALAAFGVHLAYAPLLTLLLPRRLLAIAPDRAVAVTSAIMLAGAVTASLTNIAAGRFADRWRARHGNRRMPIAAGLIATMAMLVVLGLARNIATLAIALIGFQAALNLMFAPIGALLVDHFDNRAKARMAALVNLAAPLAGLGTGLAVIAFPHDGAQAFCWVALAVGLAVLPLVLIWPFGPATLPPDQAASSNAQHGRSGRGALATVAVARTLMQGGAAFVGTYFYLFLARHPQRAGIMNGQLVDPLYGRLVLTTTLATVIVTLLAGHWSDRHRRRRAPMVAGALTGAMALMLLLLGSGWVLLAGFGLFQVALIAYLALDTALVAELLTRSLRPAEALGYINLANTLPGIAVPSLVLALSRGSAEAVWTTGFAATTACCLAAAVLIATLRSA